jgi:hypothetical protein
MVARSTPPLQHRNKVTRIQRPHRVAARRESACCFVAMPVSIVAGEAQQHKLLISGGSRLRAKEFSDGDANAASLHSRPLNQGFSSSRHFVCTVRTHGPAKAC